MTIQDLELIFGLAIEEHGNLSTRMRVEGSTKDLTASQMQSLVWFLAVRRFLAYTDQLTPEAKATSNPAGIRIETSDAIE